MKEVFIKGNLNFIKLPQLLKREGIISTGGNVKYFVSEGLIKVNGVVITEVRKKLYDGDVVEIVNFEALKIKSSHAAGEDLDVY